MDDNEMRKFNASRRELFDVELPGEVQARIDARLAQLDYERAMKALAVYRAEKPYKGFYIARFNWHYNAVPAASTDRADGPAARPKELNDYDAERAERADYARIPAAFIADCRKWFEGWGWREGSRGWMLLCIDAHAGREVEHYRCFAPIGSAGWDRERRIKQYAEADDRARLLAHITRLQSLCIQLGGDADAVTGTRFKGLGPDTGPGRPGDAARRRQRDRLAHGANGLPVIDADAREVRDQAAGSRNG